MEPGKLNSKIQIIKGDLTTMVVDAIVNAANSSLMGGGGVDGAIHRAGGPDILEACREIVAKQGRCPAGQVVITTGGKLPAKFVIHTVGPVWQGGSAHEAEILTECYRNAFALAVTNHCKSIAFPNISTGAYGFPKELAAKIAVNTIKELMTAGNQIEKVLFVCYDDENFNLMVQQLNN